MYLKAALIVPYVEIIISIDDDNDKNNVNDNNKMQAVNYSVWYEMWQIQYSIYGMQYTLCVLQVTTVEI